MANLKVSNRASALVLRTESTARDVRMAMGSERFVEPDAVGQESRVMHEYLSTNDLGATY